ncbi:hypothetical protein [Streptomyces sp. NPDC002692]
MNRREYCGPDTDADASAAELLRRAQADFAEAEARRRQLSAEERIHGQEPGRPV